MIYLEGESRNTGMGGRVPFQAHPLWGSWGAVPLGEQCPQRSQVEGLFPGVSRPPPPPGPQHGNSRFAASKEGRRRALRC